MHAFDHTSARQPICKSRLVYDIARIVKLFFDVSIICPMTHVVQTS
jgi:hypothetical protein